MTTPGLPLADLWSAYKTSRTTEMLSVHTWRRWENDFGAVRGAFSSALGVPAVALTTNHLTRPNVVAAFAAYATPGGKPRSRASVAGAVSFWTGLLDHAVAIGALEGNPMAAVHRPKVGRPGPKALDGGVETITRLLASIARGDRSKTTRHPWPERDLALFATFLICGIRSKEAAAANVSDLDGPAGARRLHVLGKGQGGGKERWSPVPPALDLMVTGYLTSRLARSPDLGGGGYGQRDPLFVGDTGGRLTPGRVRYVVDRCYAAAGVTPPSGAKVHALRHTCASLLAEKGVDASGIQGLLGHGSLATSQMYITITDARIREVVDDSPATAVLQAMQLHTEGDQS